MFSGEIYYYWTLYSSENVDKIVGKTFFFLCLIYCMVHFTESRVEKRREGIIPRWKNNGRELFLGGKTMGGNYS